MHHLSHQVSNIQIKNSCLQALTVTNFAAVRGDFVLKNYLSRNICKINSYHFLQLELECVWATRWTAGIFGLSDFANSQSRPSTQSIGIIKATNLFRLFSNETRRSTTLTDKSAILTILTVVTPNTNILKMRHC